MPNSIVFKFLNNKTKSLERLGGTIIIIGLVSENEK